MSFRSQKETYSSFSEKGKGYTCRSSMKKSTPPLALAGIIVCLTSYGNPGILMELRKLCRQESKCKIALKSKSSEFSNNM